jgi:hypothetical protein
MHFQGDKKYGRVVDSGGRNNFFGVLEQGFGVLTISRGHLWHPGQGEQRPKKIKVISFVLYFMPLSRLNYWCSELTVQRNKMQRRCPPQSAREFRSTSSAYSSKCLSGDHIFTFDPLALLILTINRLNWLGLSMSFPSSYKEKKYESRA